MVSIFVGRRMSISAEISDIKTERESRRPSLKENGRREGGEICFLFFARVELFSRD